MMKQYWQIIFNRTAALAMMTIVFAGPAFAADAGKFAIGIGMETASGDYGTETTTDSVRIPLTIEYFPTDAAGFELVIPYLYQNNSNTFLAGGMRFPFERRSGMRRTSFNTSDSVSGLGDISLTAKYLVLEETETGPALRPLLYVKFPTADEDKALGTGEFDIGGGVGVSKWFGPWFTFGEGRYIFQGSNADLGLKDFATLEGQVGYQVSQAFFPSLSMWWSSAPADDASDLAEARLKGIYWIADDIRLEGYLGTGLTSSAADFGAGLAVFLSF
jgi:hypothetical protein